MKTLGLNDVTMLVPLPSSATGTQLIRAADNGDDATPLLPRALFDTLNNIPNRPPTVDDVYADLQVFVVRFDLCDRITPGPCPDGDGRLRLVFQPIAQGMSGPVGMRDIAFHAFYTIPQADFPGLVAELRALSKLQNAPLSATLGVNPALTASTTGEYATRLKKLVTKYGGSTGLARLTFFAQPVQTSAVHWVFRGVERSGTTFHLMTIPGINANLQEATLVGSPGFDVTPVVDAPPGFALILSETAFAAATPTDQKAALGALAAADNPLTNTPSTVQCATCHTSTRLTKARSVKAGVDPTTLSARYTSTYDLSVSGGQSQAMEFTLRMLGWLNAVPLVQQRAVNETAQTATEMDTMFPK